MRIPHNERLSSDIVEAGPERKCILSGSGAARDSLTRLAISPPDGDGRCGVFPDVLARAPGRGAWIGVSRSELSAALANGKLKAALARSLHTNALSIADDLPERIMAALSRALVERLGLELRAGRLLLGSERIAEAARSGRIAWLAHASDAGADGCGRLDQAWRVGRTREGSGLRGTTLPLDRMTLSVALGRDNVVHLGLSDQAAVQPVAALATRLAIFLGTEPASDAAEPTTFENEGL